MKSKFISALLAVAIFVGIFSLVPFSTAEAWREESMIKSYEVLEEKYDKFIYLGLEAYEGDEDYHLELTDYYVQPEDWITYRLYIKSDLYIGNSMPYIAYDNWFFDVTVCTDNPVLENGYETLNENAPVNADHPMVRDQKLYHSLTSKPADRIPTIMRGFCELDVDSETLDLVMTQWNKDTTNPNLAYLNVFTSDEWLLEWKVRVREDLPEGARGISQIYYNMFKIAKRSDTGETDYRRPADISSADCTTDIPQWENVPSYRNSRPMHTNKDIIKEFIVEDTYMEFTIGENPRDFEYPEECNHSYRVETTEPDCENEGKTVYTCIECGDVITIIAPSTGHKSGDWETVLNANEGKRVKRCVNCGSVLESEAFAISVLAPDPATVNKGDSIWLHAEIIGNIPDVSEIIWTADNENFVISELSEDGKSCMVTANSEGTTVISVSAVDANGNAIITCEQEMTAETSLIQKIIEIFRNFFDDIMDFFNSIGALLGL